MRTPIRILLALAFAVALVCQETDAIAGSADKVKGIVVFADNLSPVSGGRIEVRSSAGAGLIETAVISADGTFLISKGVLDLKDEIKIMAYPNDVDGVKIEFQSSESSVRDVLQSEDSGYAIIIKVDRPAPKQKPGINY